ncbi:hypothetical protein ACSBR1_011547 [Camellia fascicularis]
MAMFFKRLAKAAPIAFSHTFHDQPKSSFPSFRVPFGAITAISGGISYYYYFSSPNLCTILRLNYWQLDVCIKGFECLSLSCKTEQRSADQLGSCSTLRHSTLLTSCLCYAESATEFSISLLQTLLIQESRVSVSELPNLVDVLAKVATRPGASDSLQQLVKTARNPAANAAVFSGFSLGKDDKAKPSIEKKGSDNATILTREEYINADSGAVDDPASFHDQGSFGTVYKGTLYKEKKLIAVKRLEKVVEEGEREFQAEMRAIGRRHHRNLVRLLGYCIEGSKRLLVYEYMRNGSLADLLFKSTRRPDWNERIRIALNVARGILYLHEECETPIIHCDIKPQNILMDEFWTAKISDFGLAKLLMPDQTRTFTGVRGTRGYVAPEWQRNNPISVKVDVYSYGIVLLEIVCCRKNLEVNVSTPEEVVLSGWVYRCFAGKELNKLHVVGDEEVDLKTLENMVKVGLWCIQDEPALRPSMKS